MAMLEQSLWRMTMKNPVIDTAELITACCIKQGHEISIGRLHALLFYLQGWSKKLGRESYFPNVFVWNGKYPTLLTIGEHYQTIVANAHKPDILALTEGDIVIKAIANYYGALPEKNLLEMLARDAHAELVSILDHDLHHQHFLDAYSALKFKVAPRKVPEVSAADLAKVDELIAI